MQGGNADVPDMKEQERKKDLFDVIYIQESLLTVIDKEFFEPDEHDRDKE